MERAIRRLIERVGPGGPWWALALTCLAGAAFKLHCGGWWTGDEQYVTGCYSDVVPFWSARGVAAGEVPYLQARMEYPVLTGALIWLEGGVARLVGNDALAFLRVAAAANAALAFLVLWLMRRAGVGLARQYGWAFAPPLVLYLAHNWDLLAIAFAVAAWLAAAAGRERGSVALAALGGAAKLFPLLLLPLVGLATLRRRGVMAATALVAIALAAWGAVNLPVAMLARDNWVEFYTFSSERAGTAASWWELAGQFGWLATDVPTRNLWALILFAGGAAAIVAAGWRRHRERPWLLFTPILGWFLLTNKVWSPQFDLWLWPFAVLTLTRVRPLALFAVGDLLAYFAEFWLFAGMDGVQPAATQGDILAAAIARTVAMLWIIHASVHDPAPEWALTPPPASPPPPEGRPKPAG